VPAAITVELAAGLGYEIEQVGDFLARTRILLRPRGRARAQGHGGG
jgi:hypothetical protein